MYTIGNLPVRTGLVVYYNVTLPFYQIGERVLNQDCTNKWKNMRDTFVRELRKVIKEKVLTKPLVTCQDGHTTTIGSSWLIQSDTES